MAPTASTSKRLPAGIWALGVSMLTVGLIEGAAEGTAIVLKVFSVALSDWWGKRKPLALLGYGLGALSKPLFALASTAGGVITARLLDRVGKGHPGGAARCAGGRPGPARTAWRGLRAAAIARYRGRLPRPLAGHGADVVVGQRFPYGVLGGRDPGRAVHRGAGLRREGAGTPRRAATH